MTIAAYTFLGTTIFFASAWLIQLISARALRDELRERQSTSPPRLFDWPKESQRTGPEDAA